MKEKYYLTEKKYFGPKKWGFSFFEVQWQFTKLNCEREKGEIEFIKKDFMIIWNYDFLLFLKKTEICLIIEKWDCFLNKEKCQWFGRDWRRDLMVCEWIKDDFARIDFTIKWAWSSRFLWLLRQVMISRLLETLFQDLKMNLNQSKILWEFLISFKYAKEQTVFMKLFI